MTPSKFLPISMIRSTQATAKNLLQFVTHPKTLIATTLIACNVVTFGLGNVSRAFAQSTVVPQEALLMMEFSPDTSLKTVVQNIKKQLPSRNLNDISITSIGSQLDFEGQTQTFSKANEDNLSAQQFVDKYPKSQNAFLKTVLAFKQAEEKNQDYENKQAISPLVKKYSRSTLQKTLDKYKVKTPNITSITLAGSLTNLTKLNEVAKGKLSAKSSILTDIAKIQAQSEAIKAKSDKETTPEAKLKVLNEETAKLFQKELDKNPELKAQFAGQPDLSGITQEQIQAIDAQVKTDLSGNKYISNDKIKSAVGTLTLAQVQSVQKAITNFNNTPDEVKDGSSGSVQAITQTTTAKSAEKNEDSTVEKILSSLSNFGSVKADAYYNSNIGYGIQYFSDWWGVGYFLPNSLIQEFEWNTGNFGFGYAFGLLTSRCVANFACYLFAGIMAATIYGISWWNRYQCNQRGVWVYKNLLTGPIWFGC